MNNTDADKAAEESVIYKDKLFELYLTDARDEFVKSITSQDWNTELRVAAEDILIAYDQMRERIFSQSPPDVCRAALEKYGQHLSTCNINQDWSEAYDAMANTPNEFRDEGYWEALVEMDEKRKKCTCGLSEALSTKRSGEQDELWSDVINVCIDAFDRTGIERHELIKELKSKYTLTIK